MSKVYVVKKMVIMNSTHPGLVDESTADSRRWTAIATVTIQDPVGNPVNNATVAGSWRDGTRGSASCVTGTTGQCQLTKSNLKLNVGSVLLTIDDVTGTGLLYDVPVPPDAQILDP